MFYSAKSSLALIISRPKTISDFAISRKLTELVMRDGFDRPNIRKYRLGIDAKCAI